MIERKIIKAPEGKRIIRVKIVDGGRAIEVCAIPKESKPFIPSTNKLYTSKDYLDENFPIVSATTLSKNDDFLKREPQSEMEDKLKEGLFYAIEKGVSNFRMPRLDPSIDSKTGKIIFKAGEKPALNKSPEWFFKKFKTFMPTKNSRMATESHRNIYLGLIIKYLIEQEGYGVGEAWNAICNESKELGHFSDSELNKGIIEPTGQRPVGIWFDLGNTCKYITDDERSEFLLVGGDYSHKSTMFSVSHTIHAIPGNYKRAIAVGQMIMDV